MSSHETSSRSVEQAPQPEIAALFSSIFQGEISPQEQQILERQRRHYESLEGDQQTFDAIVALREEVEAPEKWKKVSEAAEQELVTLPSNILEQLFTRFAPYIKAMPAGHSKGHFMRDSINMSLLSHDTKMSQYPPVEVFAGLLAGMFHDIGTAVVPRYDDNKRFAAHAEVGADVFGKVTSNILPENIRKMAQLAIAAHTHVTADRAITRDDGTGEWIDDSKVEIKDQSGQDIAAEHFTGEAKTKDKKTGEEKTRKVRRHVRKVYDDKVGEDGSKTALWIVRWTDRLDTRGVTHATRHILTKANPTHDFTSEQYHQIKDDEMEDFKLHFNPKREKPNTLAHLEAFAKSDTAQPPVYNLHDTPFMTNSLFGPENQIQSEFIRAVEDQDHQLARMTPEQKEELKKDGLDKFFKLARILEPAPDIEDQIKLLQEKFDKLGEGTYNWALGFKQLYEKLYPETYARKEQGLAQAPHLSFANTTVNAKINDIVGNHLRAIAKHALPHFRLPQGH